MGRVSIIYGTNMGKTELLAYIVRQVLNDEGIECDLYDVKEATKKDMLASEVTVLGCSTWTGGELQEDFIPFEAEMRTLDLEGRKAAVFGPADSIFSEFGRSVDVLEKTLIRSGAKLIADSLKIDESTTDGFFAVERWARDLADVIRKK